MIDLDGNAASGLDHAGGDVMLWMWAPWCSVCNREAPAVATVAAEFAGQVQIVGLPGNGEVQAHREFVAKHGLEGVPQIMDVDGSIWAAYGVNYQPAWVFINQDGAAEPVPGAIGVEGLRARLAALVAA